jgi:hypothetical protein
MNHSDYMKMPMDDLRAMCSARGLGKFTGQGAKMKMAGALVRVGPPVWGCRARAI